VSAILNIGCFWVIGSVSAEQVLNPDEKMVLDYYVICVTLVSWLRFFSFFLVIRQISKLLHTLFRMLSDTLGFIFLISCYFTMAATGFTTFFQQIEPENFGSVTLSLKTLYNAFIGKSKD
jgi:hypothetical protein